jgi:hypothetical protein
VLARDLQREVGFHEGKVVVASDRLQGRDAKAGRWLTSHSEDGHRSLGDTVQTERHRSILAGAAHLVPGLDAVLRLDQPPGSGTLDRLALAVHHSYV